MNERWLTEYELEEDGIEIDPYKFAKEQGIRVMAEFELAVLGPGDAILGALFITLTPETFSFDIAVSPHYRRRGLAGRLVDEAINIYGEYLEAYPEMEFLVDVVSPDMERILKRRGFVERPELGGKGHVMMTMPNGTDELDEGIYEHKGGRMKNRKETLLEALGFEVDEHYQTNLPLFEDEDDDDDDFDLDFGDDEDFGGGGAPPGGGGGDLDFDFDDDSDLDFGDEGEDPEGEEEEEEEEEEEAEPPSPEEIAAEIGSDSIGNAISNAIERALEAGLEANVVGESSCRARGPRRSGLAAALFEDEEFEAKLPQIDVVVYALEIANLIQNYTTLLDIPTTIYNRAKAYVADNYGAEWAEAFDTALSELNVSVDLGGDGRGAMANKDFKASSSSNVNNASPAKNPMTGSMSVGASGGGGGGGGI